MTDSHTHHDEEKSNILISGAVWKKGWTNWARRYAEITDGQWLVLYKEQHGKVSLVVNLANLVEFTETIPATKVHRQHCFALKLQSEKSQTVTHYLAVDTKEYKDEWICAINIARSIASVEKPMPAWIQAPKAPGKVEVSWKAKLLSKVAPTSIGKAVIATFFSQDAITIIDIIYESLKKLNNGSTKLADQFQSIIFSTGVDLIYLVNDKVLSKETLLMIKDPIFRLWSDVLDMLEISFIFDEDRILESVDGVYKCIEAYIMPLLPAAKRQQLPILHSIFSSKDNVVTWYTDAKFEVEREKFKEVLRKVWDRTFMLEEARK